MLFWVFCFQYPKLAGNLNFSKKPRCAQALNNNELPKYRWSKADMAKSRRAKLRKSSDRPSEAMSKAKSVKPGRTEAETNKNKPSCVKLLSDMKLAMLPGSSTSSSEPKQVLERMGNRESIFTRSGTSSKLSNLTPSNTKKGGPKQLKLCKNDGKSKLATSKAEGRESEHV